MANYRGKLMITGSSTVKFTPIIGQPLSHFQCSGAFPTTSMMFPKYVCLHVYRKLWNFGSSPLSVWLQFQFFLWDLSMRHPQKSWNASPFWGWVKHLQGPFFCWRNRQTPGPSGSIPPALGAFAASETSFPVQRSRELLDLVGPHSIYCWSMFMSYPKILGLGFVWEFWNSKTHPRFGKGWKIMFTILSKARYDKRGHPPLFTNPLVDDSTKAGLSSAVTWKTVNSTERSCSKASIPSRHHGHPWLGWFGGTLMTWETPIWYDPIYSQAHMDMFWKSVPPFYSTDKSWFPFNDHLLEVSQFETKRHIFVCGSGAWSQVSAILSCVDGKKK